MPAAYCSTLFLGAFLIVTAALQWYQKPAYPLLIAVILADCCAAGAFGLIGRRTRMSAATLLALSLGTAIAFANVARTTHRPGTLTVDTYATGSIADIEGIIVAEPDRRPLQTKYTIAARSIRFPDSGTFMTPVTGRVLVTDPAGWPQYRYGERIRATGVLEKPGRIESFSYDRYLSRYGIYSVMYRARIDPTGEGGDGHALLRFLFGVKERFERQISRLYAEPHASFMAGLLTGSRRGIPATLMDDFNATGLTHIIAISGYNITIVVTVISGMLFWLPLRWRLLPSIAAIAAFTLFVGASAAVVRAAIMGMLGLLALQAGRESQSRLTILWTVFFMLLWNPKQLWYDAGFQLSFLAVLGLSEVSPLLEPLFRRVPKTFGIREALQMTMAAQISAVPLIILLFGRLSLVAPIANLLVGPFVPFAMLFGFAGTALSALWFPIGQVVAYLGWGCLEWIIRVTTLLARLPLASVETPRVGIGILAAYYVLLIALIILAKRAVTSDTA